MDGLSTDNGLHTRHEGAERALNDVDELEAARLVRLHVSQNMTMSERLARTHALCAQLATLRPIEQRAHDGS